MPLPFDYATRVLVGVEVRDVLVHLNRDIGAFSDYWDRSGRGTFGLIPGTASYQWEALDHGRAFGVDSSNLRFEHRSTIPFAVERELGASPPGMTPARRLDELISAVQQDVHAHLREVCLVVHAGPIRRVGVAVEMEVDAVIVSAMLSPLASSIPGAVGVTEAVGKVVVSLGARDDIERRVIIGVGPAPGTGQRISRFLPAGPDILILSFDYQEVHAQPTGLLPRAARRAGEIPDLPQVVASTIDRAMEAARGFAR